MTTSIGNINAFSYGSTIASSPTINSMSKLYVPVSKSALVYSHFEHVSGVVAKNGESGVSITKLNILNSLIEHMSAIKNEPAKKFDNISDSMADSLIKNYQQQLHKALQTPYILSGAQPMAGDLFSIQA